MLYSGYNDLSVENHLVFRHRSPIFIWTGYLPLLPAFTADKIRVWKNRLTGEETPVFAPPSQGQIEQTSRALRERLGQLSDSGSSSGNADGNCSPRWSFYCQQISEAINLALNRQKSVLVVTEPYISDGHVEQQLELENMLKKRFAGANLKYLNLGRTVDLRDRSLCWDGMHLSEEGNRRIAAAMAQSALEMLR